MEKYYTIMKYKLQVMRNLYFPLLMGKNYRITLMKIFEDTCAMKTVTWKLDTCCKREITLFLPFENLRFNGVTWVHKLMFAFMSDLCDGILWSMLMGV